MNYYDKYLKYKTKYNTLKLQLGGKMLKGGAGLNLFLPCDIHNYTEKFMIKVKNYNETFKELLGDKILTDIYLNIGTDSTQKFIQDTTIIFNKPDGQKYIICIGKECNYQIDNPEFNNDFKSLNELLFGGNFISTPPNLNIPENLGVIIITKTQHKKKNLELDKLLDFLRDNINDRQKIITINCSFQHSSGSIHIDELLCPMPYNLYDVFPGYKMNYKIWIYKIVNIDLTENINKINEYNIKNSEYAKKLEKRKQFEDTDPRKKHNEIGNRLALHSDDELKIIARKFLEAMDNFNKIPRGSIPLRRKYREETMIDEYKFDDLFNYSVFFNYILDPDFNKEIVKDATDVIVVLPDLREKLLRDFNDELEENKKIIGSSIFTPEIYNQYKEEINRNFFVEYPVDLTFYDVDNQIYGFNMLKPPIFNRVFIKLQDKNYSVIPINTNEPLQVLLDFINRESQFMIENINFKYVNTRDYHIEGSIGAGGNIHCLSKQIFK